jgi:hypothetical protein
VPVHAPGRRLAAMKHFGGHILTLGELARLALILLAGCAWLVIGPTVMRGVR